MGVNASLSGSIGLPSPSVAVGTPSTTSTMTRGGTAHMHSILQKITHGTATLDDLAMLEDMSTVIKQTSLCGLGQSAPNPVLSTWRHFRDEYLEHIVDHTCRAHVCSIREVVS